MSVDQYITSGILELYAANALPPEEMREVEEMAEQHPQIRQELEAITQALKRYAELYAPKLSDGLYEKILKRINETPIQVAEAETRPAPVVPLYTEKPAAKESPKTFSIQNSTSNRSYVMLIAASIALLLVSVAANIYLYSQYNNATGRITAMQNEKNTLVNNTTATKAKYEQAALELKVITEPHNKMVMMKGMPISPGSEAMVMWNTANKNVYVDVHRLPPPPTGMQYQLWAIDTDGKPVDAGMLASTKEPTADGPQTMKKINSAVAFAITLEKKGGNPTPTMDQMYLKGAV
jgi:hypothetical protein